jgi:heat shock protein HslJ
MIPSDRRSRVLRVLRAAVVAAAAALPLVSCSNGVTGPSDLIGGVWKLQSMRVAGATTDFVPDDPSRFTIEFKDDGNVGVRADCNSCGGPYTVSDDQLTVNGLACTLIACPGPNGSEFAGLLEGTTELDKDGEDTLEIVSSDGRLLLKR